MEGVLSLDGGPPLPFNASRVPSPFFHPNRGTSIASALPPSILLVRFFPVVSTKFSLFYPTT